MGLSVATLGLELDSSGMRAGLNDLRNVERAGNRAADALDDAGRRGAKATRSIADGFGTLKAAIAGLGLATAIKQVVAIYDEYASITGRLKLVTGSTEQLAKVQEDLFQVAQRTGVSYAETANLYAKTAKNADALGLSQKQLLEFTELTNQAIQVSGATAEEAAGGVRQLGQALASGALRGDEFNSLAQNMPRLRDAIADGLGKSAGELREFAAQGKLTAEVVTRALLSQKDAISREFTQLPVTVGRAMTELENAFKKAIAGADMSPLTESIRDFKETVTDPATIQGIQSIAQGLVSLAALAASAAGAFGNLGKGIGEAIARARGFVVPEDELRRLTDLRDLAIQTRNEFDVIARTRQIESLIEKFPALRQTIANSVGGSVAPVLAFTNSLSRLGGVAADVAIPLRAASDVMIPFRDGKAAEAVKKFSEEIEKQLVGMRSAYELIKDGIPIEEALTRAKLMEAGASAAQIAEYLKLETALDRATAAKKAYNDVTDPYGTSMASAQNIDEGWHQTFDPLIDQANRLYDETRTPMEKYQAELGNLQAALDRFDAGISGGIDLDVFSRAKANLDRDLRFTPLQAEIDKVLDKFQKDQQTASARVDIGAISPQGARGEVAASATVALDGLSQYREQLDSLVNEGVPGAKEALADLDISMAQVGQSALTGFQSVVQGYVNSTADLSATLGGDFVNAIDGAIQSVSQLAAEFILFGEGGKEAVAQIARQLATELLASLIKVGVQMAVNAVLGQTLGAAAVASAQAQASAAQAFWTPAAIAASTATLGGAAAIGAGAYTAALASGVAANKASMLAGFESGGYTGNGGLDEVAGVVHKREFVMNASATSLNRPLLEHLNAGGAPQIRAPQGYAAPAAAAPPQAPRKTIVRNEWAPSDVRSDILDSEEADEIIINRMARNASRIRSSLGV